MRFRINRDDCFCREEERGTLSLIVKKNNQILYLNESGREVLNFPGQWKDLDEFIEDLDFEGAPREKIRADYEALIYKLDAYGLAEVEGIDRGNLSGCRIATARDCAALSRFLTDNISSGFSCAVSTNPANYDKSGVYFRMMSQRDITVVNEVEGNIVSALIISWPNRAAGYTALSLNSAVFDGNMTPAEAIRALEMSLKCIKEVFGKACSKIRYCYMNSRQDRMLKALADLGFKQTALFEREILSGRDEAFYDLFF